MSPQVNAVRASLKFATEICLSPLAAVILIAFAGCHDANESGINAIVTGNSMAPAFWGDHVRAECDECKYSFRVAGRQEKLPEELVCPNCGFRSAASKAESESAERVIVVKRPSQHSEFRRWDVVAFRQGANRPAMVKRVIGLPGESIQIVDGDLFADGVILQKPLNIARRMRVPVFDSRFSSDAVRSRFQPLVDAKGWRLLDGQWQYSPTEVTDMPQWLTYQQWRCVASSLPREQVVPIEDWYAANAAVNRNLNVTNDVWVKIEFRAEKDCQFELKLNRGSASHVLEFNFGSERVSFEGRSFGFRDQTTLRIPDAAGIPSVKQRSYLIEACTFDQQLTLLVNGSAVMSAELPQIDEASSSRSMVQIGGLDSHLEIDRFRLWRDIYYFDVLPVRSPDAATSESRLRAQADEYILLGDNVPVSIDSRHWPLPAVSADEILGVVSPIQ